MIFKRLKHREVKYINKKGRNDWTSLFNIFIYEWKLVLQVYLIEYDVNSNWNDR